MRSLSRSRRSRSLSPRCRWQRRARGARPAPSTRRVRGDQRLIDDATRRSRCCAKSRTRPAKPSAEQYEPTSVDTVLGNPTVDASHASRRRRQAEDWSSGRRPPPTSPGSATTTTSNLAGDPLGDTCVYARDFAKLMREGKAPPTTYAHIAREADHAGFVLQYWFFWYFNQFNDLHEGDWEGMQITFEANTPARGAGRRTERNDPLPARRRRARRLGRLEGAEGRDAPDRLPGGRLARDLLRLRRLRPERPERLRRRLRQHHRAAARTAAAAGR